MAPMMALIHKFCTREPVKHRQQSRQPLGEAIGNDLVYGTHIKNGATKCVTVKDQMETT